MIGLSPVTKQLPIQAGVQAEQYVFRRSWGAEGSVLLYPKDVAISPDGKTIYIANSSRDRVTVVNRLQGTYTTWGESGSGNGQFNGPRGIAVDSAGWTIWGAR